jgi:putative aldouronate transport system permease protein
MTSIKESAGDRILVAFIWTCIGFFLTIVLYPLIIILSSSVSSPDLIATGQVLLFPRGLNVHGYQRVFQDPMIMTGYMNTILYAVVGTAINMVVTVPAGYALARNRLPGRKLVTFLFMFTMYFSGGLIPTFLLINNIGLFDTRAVMVLAGAFSVWNCIICIAFFRAIPAELEEAALIDGCSPIRSFIQVVLPVSQALLGVMTLFFVVGHWNSFFIAMIYTMDDRIIPLQLVLRRILVLEQAALAMMEDGGADEAALAGFASRVYLIELIKYAVIVISAFPLLILYPFLQKYFVKGVMIGSLKG